MIDHARLAAVAHGSATTQAEILADFRQGNARDAALLREAVRRGDFPQISDLAHRIKGASMMLGAARLAETCSLASMAGRDCDRQAVEGAVVFLERELAELDQYLEIQCSRLPAAASLPMPLAPQEAPLLCSNLRFLVVEDHSFQRDLIIRFLLRQGALEVRGFADGGAALLALNSQAADIMVLDFSMPGIDGMDLMRALSGAGHPISVILNSALSPSLMASLILVARSLRVNLLGALNKPMTQEALAPLIAKFRADRIDATATFQ